MMIVYAVAESGEQCHVYILDLYREKVPNEADIFLLSTYHQSTCSYRFSMVLYITYLQNMLPMMCKEAGIAI